MFVLCLHAILLRVKCTNFSDKPHCFVTWWTVGNDKYLRLYIDDDVGNKFYLLPVLWTIKGSSLIEVPGQFLRKMAKHSDSERKLELKAFFLNKMFKKKFDKVWPMLTINLNCLYRIHHVSQQRITEL